MDMGHAPDAGAAKRLEPVRGHGGALGLAPLDHGLGHLVGQRVRPHRVVQGVHRETLRLEVRRGDLALELVRAVGVKVVDELHGVLLRITVGYLDGQPTLGLRQLEREDRHGERRERAILVAKSQVLFFFSSLIKPVWALKSSAKKRLFNVVRPPLNMQVGQEPSNKNSNRNPGLRHSAGLFSDDGSDQRLRVTLVAATSQGCRLVAV